MDINTIIYVGMIVLGLIVIYLLGSNKEKNYINDFLDTLRDSFEHANPSIFSLVATGLPYLSPLPVAVITSKSAETFLGFKGFIGGVFVFVLEALGLWVTSALVDSIVDYIKSRNSKSIIMVGVFGVVTIAYVTILITLNVTLKQATLVDETLDKQAYLTVITLICFLPLISGFMNGFYKIKLDDKREAVKKSIEEQSKQEKEKADAERIRIQNEEIAFRRQRELEESQRQHELELIRLKNEAKHQKDLLKKNIVIGSNGEEIQVQTQTTQVDDDRFVGMSDWRKVVTMLEPEEIEELANANARVKNAWAKKTGKTSRTIDNWQKHAQLIIQKQNAPSVDVVVEDKTLSPAAVLSEYIKTNGVFPNEEFLKNNNISPRETALFIVENEELLVNNAILTFENIEGAKKSLGLTDE